jgi:hypothetical protein
MCDGFKILDMIEKVRRGWNDKSKIEEGISRSKEK